MERDDFCVVWGLDGRLLLLYEAFKGEEKS